MKALKHILIIWNLISIIIFFKPELYSIFGKLSWYLLIIIVYSRPLADIFNKADFLKKIVCLRKEIWIVCAIFGITHSFWFFLSQNNIAWFLDSYYYLSSNWYWFWMYALIISIPLLITSNIFSVKLLWKYWKKIQRLTYLFFIFIWIHIIILKPHDKIQIILIMAVWLILWIKAYLIKQNNEKFNSIK